MDDALIFISLDLPHGLAIIFACDTFLYSNNEDIHGKIMYSSSPVYGKNTILEHNAGYKLYKTAYRNSIGNKIEFLTDHELQEVGVTLGLMPGSGIDQHLCRVSNVFIKEVMFSPRFLEIFNTSEDKYLADEIGRKYEVAPEELLITGGLHLFPRPICDAHDIDIVVPIDNYHQLSTWYPEIMSVKSENVSEYGFRWPLRWRSSRSHLVCPFFIYRNLQPCVPSFIETTERIESRVTVIDDRFSIFNAPTLFVRGACDILVVRSTFLRGMLRKGLDVDLACPVYFASDGIYSGAKVGVITNPFTEILNIGKILSAYRS